MIQPGSRTARALSRFAVAMLIIASYFAFSVPRKVNWPLFRGTGAEYYSLLADAFLAGRTSLPIKPDPRLLALADPYDHNANFNYRLHDASLYNGNYYLYYGPAPAVILFLPYTALTRSHLPNRIAIPLFCTAVFLLAWALFQLLCRSAGWVVPLWLELMIAITLGSSTYVYILFKRPAFYETAVAAGAACLMAGFLALGSAVTGGRHELAKLFASGLFFGLAAGCRPHFAMVAILMIAAVLWRERRNFPKVLVFTLPVAACGFALAAYNFVRFGSPFDFGVRYQLSSLPAGFHAHLAAALPTLLEYLFVPLELTTRIPYVHAVRVFPYVGLASFSRFADEPYIGILFAAPLIFAALVFTPVMILVRDFRNFLSDGMRWVMACLYVAAIAILATLCVSGWLEGRYVVDFAPLLAVCAACSLVLLWQNFPRLRTVAAPLLCLAVAWTFLVSIAFAFPGSLSGEAAARARTTGLPYLTARSPR
jgi:hypothetical protein